MARTCWNTLPIICPARIIAEARCDLEAVERAMRRLPHRHRTVLVALRLEDQTRQEVADRCRVSLTSVDRMLRQALDYCAEETGQTVTAGISATGVSVPARGLFSRRWRTQAADAEVAAEATPMTRQRNEPQAARSRYAQSRCARTPTGYPAELTR